MSVLGAYLNVGQYFYMKIMLCSSVCLQYVFIVVNVYSLCIIVIFF